MRNTLIGAACACLVLVLMGAAAVGGRIMTLDDSATAPLHVMGGYTTKTGAIAGAGTDSAEVDTEGYTIMGYSINTDHEGTVFQWKCATATGGTFISIYDTDGAICAATLVNATAHVVNPPSACALAVSACRFQKVVMASQTGETTVTWLLK